MCRYKFEGSAVGVVSQNTDLSVIVPLYNEEENVEALYAAIATALRPLGLNHEIIFVDDGSSDGTVARARSLAASDPCLRIIKFRRNYGQTPAMAAGIDHARGEILVTMDGDLQNDPADIGRLIEKIGEGYDIVVGWRHNRQDKLISRKIPSLIANRLIGKVTGVPIKDNGCSLKAYRARLIKHIPLYSEMHRFIPAMTSLAGARIYELKVSHHARKFGQSKYGLSRIYKVLLDLLVIKTIVSFSARPLVWFAMLATPLVLVTMAMFVWMGSLVLSGAQTPLVVPMGVGLVFATGATFLLLGGVLCELVSRTGNFKRSSLAYQLASKTGFDSV
jgi:glycosyltransferase involved in cell wall biosynthesis